MSNLKRIKAQINVKAVFFLLTAFMAALGIISFTGTTAPLNSVYLILVPFIYLYLKRYREKNLTKGTKALLIGFTVFFLLCTCVGRYINDHLSITALICMPFIGYLLYLLLSSLSFMLSSLSAVERKKKSYMFTVFWGIILIGFAFYFVAVFPAITSYDSLKQISMANGEIPLTDHHPVLHTMLIKLCLMLGNGSLWVYTAMQTVLISLVFAFAVYYIYAKGVAVPWIVFSLFWFGFFPINGVFAMTMQKDSLFGAAVLLFTIVLTELTLTKGAAIKKPLWIILFAVSVIGVAFLRNNGVYVLLIALFILIFSFKKYTKHFAVAFISFLIVFAGVKFVLFPALNVQKSHFVESVGIPLQQIARVVKAEFPLTNEQEEIISSYLPLETIREQYNPDCVDYLKSEVYGAHFNHESLESNKADFFKVWLQLLVKYPKTYVKAYLEMTDGYWDIFRTSYVSGWNFNDNLIPKFSAYTGVAVFKCYNQAVPFFGLLFSSAAIIFTVLYIAILSFQKNGLSGLIPFLPVVLIWLSILVAAPIDNYLRYVYAIFTCLPVLEAVLPLNLKFPKTVKAKRINLYSSPKNDLCDSEQIKDD